MVVLKVIFLALIIWLFAAIEFFILQNFTVYQASEDQGYTPREAKLVANICKCIFTLAVFLMFTGVVFVLKMVDFFPL